jgi:hypothetical protein
LKLDANEAPWILEACIWQSHSSQGITIFGIRITLYVKHCCVHGVVIVILQLMLRTEGKTRTLEGRRQRTIRPEFKKKLIWQDMV